MHDLISRQAAIELIKNYCENGCDIVEDNWCPSCQREQFIELLKAMPSVIPKGVTVTDFADKCRECGREKVLDKIKEEIRELATFDTVDVLVEVDKIIDKYKEVDREYKESKWVKVEDELPELYREVWLSCRDYEVWLSCRGYKKVVRGYLSPDYHKSWYVYDSECGYYNINNVNAWMYVERPKPYKAESEDKK